MVREKTTNRGTMAASNVAKTFLEFLLDAEMSSREDSSIINNIAIKAPPTPTPMAVERDMALLEALVVVMVIMLSIWIEQSISNIKLLSAYFHY